MYNTIVATPEELQAIENNPYYTQRLTEAQLADARAEAEAKGEVRGKIEGATMLAELVKKGFDLDAALKMIEGGN